MKHVIAFTGYRTIGKTTTANNIAEYLNHCKIPTTKLSFANLLREWIKEKYGSEIEQDTKINKNKTVKKLPVTKNISLQFNLSNRDLMIKTGEYLRSLDKDIFANAVCNIIKQINLCFPKKKQDSVFIIDDLRFENEMEKLKALEFYINPYDLTDVINVHIVYISSPREKDVSEEDKNANDFIDPSLCDYTLYIGNIEQRDQYNLELVNFLNKIFKGGINIG